MARLALFVSLGLVFSSLPSGLAGPACARTNFKVADCVERCRSRWGWTGSMMGTDPWGSVVQKADSGKNWDAVLSQACGSPIPSTTASTSSYIRATATPEAVASTASVTTSSVTRSTTTTSLPSSSPSSTSSISSPSSSTSSTTFSPPATLGLVTTIRSRSITTTPAPTSTSRAPTQNPVITTSAPKPTTTAPANTPPPSGGSGGTSSADIQAYLLGHNSVRAQHGASPLTWSDNLASAAQQWANGCQFKHSGGSLGAFGENLAAGTGSSYGIVTAVKSWTDEVSQYNPNNPVASHFTQVVWKGTTQVGCAVQSCSGIFDSKFGLAKYFVCEYSAQGNIVGRFAENVQV